MKIVTCEYQGQFFLGAVDGEQVCLPALQSDVVARDMLSLIRSGDKGLKQFRQQVAETSENCSVPLAQLNLLAPIPRPPQNIICLGWNYASHAKETGRLKRDEELRYPAVFTKASHCVNAPYGDIPFDSDISEQIDWEVELGIVVGKNAHKVKAANALDYVFGYLVINDISARDIQQRHRQFFLGKSLPGCCPMGPWIVTKDAITTPQNLQLSCLVNGQVKQQANTEQQIFGVAEIIELLSSSMLLEAGTVIASGTPEGVGVARKPPEFLKHGDVVECTIANIGSIRNTVKRVP